MRALLACVLLAFAPSAMAHPPTPETPHWQAASSWPDRIITTFTEVPQTGFAVTWRTDTSVGRTIAQIVEATPDTRFELDAETVLAETESIDLEAVPTEAGPMNSLENIGLGRAHYHSAVFTGLKPDTLYAWRVQGGRGHWSEWFQTRTAAASGPIRFVYFGDAQNGIRSHWSRVIRMAYQTVPDADFFLHAGDLVQKGDSDYNWAEWFDAGDFIHAMLPAIPVPGNHENVTVWTTGADGEPRRERVRTPLWRVQFTLPAEPALPEALQEQAYQIHYSEDLDIFVVDSARDEFADQAAWLDAALEASTARWKVVTMHHPFFAPPEMQARARDMDRQRAFLPVIQHHEVDLVLTGHIHTYGRLTGLENTRNHAARSAGGTPTDIDTIYVVSASGAKNDQIWSLHPDTGDFGDGAPDYQNMSIDRVAENTPMFQVIEIDGGDLSYEARTATGEVYDAFRVTKDAVGHKRLVEGQQAFGDTRYFSNTGNYEEWWDLR